MRELIHIRVHVQVVFIVIAETSNDLLRHEVHNKHVCIFATYGHQSPLWVKLSHLGIDS